MHKPTFLLERERVHQNAAAPDLIEVLGQSAIRVAPECTPVDFAIVAGGLQHMDEPIVLEAQCRAKVVSAPKQLFNGRTIWVCNLR